jgi:hypothetical protein
MLISVVWSKEILSEMTGHLVANLSGFDEAAAQRLTDLMNEYFPAAEIEPNDDCFTQLNSVILPDEDDHHVLAAALAAEADAICTMNTKDFPADAIARLGLGVASPDDLLCGLIAASPHEMAAVHAMVLEDHAEASGEEALAHLMAAGAPNAARQLAEILGYI